MYKQIDNHLTLASLTPESARQLFPLFREDIADLIRWFGFDENYSMEHELQYLSERVLPYDDAIIPSWDGTPCGRIGIYDYDAKERSIYLYYWISSRFRRKGIARLSIAGMLDHLRSLGIRQVLFDVDRVNLPSINLLQNLPGVYVKDDTHENYDIYAVNLA